MTTIHIILRNAYCFSLRNARASAWLHTPRRVMVALMKAVAAEVDTVRDHMRDVDRTLLRENLKLSFEQRAQKHLRVLQMVEELRRAGKKLRQKSDGR
jgi:hypothetical protein